MPRRATAFAPAAITNFFQIHYGQNGLPNGATGGGYVLSKGTRSRATFEPASANSLAIAVNGDRTYNARTTRRAVQLLVGGFPEVSGNIALDQTVETPIGSGFGSSAASAVSGVYAAAAAMGIRRPKSPHGGGSPK